MTLSNLMDHFVHLPKKGRWERRVSRAEDRNREVNKGKHEWYCGNRLEILTCPLSHLADRPPLKIWKISHDLSRSGAVDSRYPLKYFEISVPQHIRFAELRKTINQTTKFHKFIYVLWLLKLEIYWNIVEKRRNCFLWAIFPLFHSIFNLLLDFCV